MNLEFSYESLRETMLKTIEKSKIGDFCLKYPNVKDLKYFDINEEQLRLLVGNLRHEWISTKIKGKLKYIKNRKIYFSESCVDYARVKCFIAKRGSFYQDKEHLYYQKNDKWCAYWKSDYVRFSIERIKDYIFINSLRTLEYKIKENKNEHNKLVKSLENVQIEQMEL